MDKGIILLKILLEIFSASRSSFRGELIINNTKIAAVESEINPSEINECDECPEGYISSESTNICVQCKSFFLFL